MRLLTTLPQDDLREVSAAARAAEAAGYDGLATSADLIQGIRRIPSPFLGHQTLW
jgi:alkanesulfonate monooxygenase SsuD/methylene tetrahydromethanopterin reductase-like flavin-dependent oxidoreductase (luciferase family)